MADVDQREQTLLPLESEVEAEANSHTNFLGSLFRIAKCEYSKFFHMAVMFFLIAYVYSVLRDTKDAVVLDRQESASVVFLKQLVTIISTTFVILIQYLSTKITMGNLLRYFMIGFGIYFAVFAFILYPLAETLEFDKFMAIDKFGDGKLAYRGLGIIYPLSLVFNFWVTSLLYISSELWGNLVLLLLFLSYSNDVCTFHQSLRFIPLFYISSNIGLFLSGLTMYGVAHIQDNYSYEINQISINGIFVLSSIIVIICLLVHYRLEKSILTKPIFILENQTIRKKKEKTGYVDGLKQVIQSRFLFYLCLTVLGYNICTNFVDLVFKNTMKVASMDENVSTETYVIRTSARNQIITATCVILILTTPLGQSIQKFGWAFAASITPIFSICAGLVLMSLVFYNCTVDNQLRPAFLNGKFTFGSESLLYLEYIIGIIAVTGLKVSKYAFFDVSKEAISMKIPKEKRAFYKSIYDGICGKFGKSAGSIFVFGLSSVMNADNARSISFWLLLIMGGLILLWMRSLIYLIAKYNEAVSKNTDVDLDIVAKKVKA